MSLAVVIEHSLEYTVGSKLGISLPALEAVVMELMAPYLSRGYNLYIDNWYSSPTLFEKLLEANTNVVGTIRLNRKNIPEELKEQQPEKGDAIAMYSHKMTAVKWPDKKKSYDSDNA